MMRVYKEYGLEFHDDNVCDAFALSEVARMVFNKIKPKYQYQENALLLVNKQL